ncbi:MAG: hypothetical protein SR1Q7_10420 [Quinella sp. 1Q7]|nr:hypothetical protein [Quinella sp. 1Q7]
MFDKIKMPQGFRMNAAKDLSNRNVGARLQGQASRLPAWLVVSLCAGTFLIMNLLTPMFGDDYAYSFIWDGAHDGNFQNNVGRLERLKSLDDIIQSQWAHYLTWGGRTVAHIFVQFFCLTGKLFFDFMNSLIYAALALLIYSTATGKLDVTNFGGGRLLWIFFAMWWCIPEFFQTSLWMTGACNYLWMGAVQLAFLLPFSLTYWRKNFWTNESIGMILLMAILGLAAGWSNESGGAMIIFLTFLALIYFRSQGRLEQWMIVGFAMALVGYALMILAPGNVHRFQIDSDLTEETLFSAQMFIDNFENGLREIIFSDVPLFLPIIAYFMRGRKTPETSRFILAFAAAAVLLPCLLMFAPEFPARAAFTSPIFSLIASVVALEQTRIHLPSKIFSAALILWLATTIYAVGVDWSVHSQMAARYEYVDEHKFDPLIVVAPIDLPDIEHYIYWKWTLDEYARFYGDLTPYRHDFNNRNITYAQYYGLNEIILDEAAWKKLPQFTLY